jgi:hypothetical protein
MNIIKSVKIKMRVHGQIVRWEDKINGSTFDCTWDKILEKYMCRNNLVDYYEEINGLWYKPISL